MLPSSLQPFFFLLFLILHATKLDADSHQFIYNGFKDTDLSLNGEASVTRGLLNLGNVPQKSGIASRSFPSSAGKIPSFSTSFVFIISSDYANRSANGFALVISPYIGSQRNLEGMYMGLDPFDGEDLFFAVEFDTKQDDEFFDINNHVGLDIKSLMSHQRQPARYYTPDGFKDLTLCSGEPIQAWVEYDSKAETVNVTLAPYLMDKPRYPLISLSDFSLFSMIPPDYQLASIGFSSATGPTHSGHYILGWSFTTDGEAQPLNHSALPLKVAQDFAKQDHLKPPNSQRQEQDRRQPRNHHILPIVILSVLVAMPVLVAVIVVLPCRKKKAGKCEDWEAKCGPPSFRYKDLVTATGGFKDNMLLGRGGFGRVYKGVLPVTKQNVAIKRVSPESKQGMEEFVAEIAILGHVRHHNLVQLLGYCRYKKELLLVYDYMPNGSLNKYLHDQDNTTTIGWSMRLGIIKGIASGLFYLHEEWEHVVIHRDIKTSNVLLDTDMNGRLGDFGLARLHDHGADAHTTHVAGTWGYIAPELSRLGKPTKATDVFAFGIFMIEVTCGRRPIITRSAHDDPIMLVDWVLETWQNGSITDATDPRLEDCVAEDAELVLKIGLLCSHPSPNVRPRMQQVVQYLERVLTLSDYSPSFFTAEVYSDDTAAYDQYVMSCPETTLTGLSGGR